MSDRIWGRVSLERCRVAEQALSLALRQGVQATGEDLARHWAEASGGQPVPEAAIGRWSRVLGPAIEAGRVVWMRVGKRTFYATADAADLPLPDHPRAYGRAVQERCGRVEVLVVETSRTLGRMVNGRDLAQAWRQRYRTLLDQETARWTRSLEPAIVAGRVRVVEVRGTYFFAPQNAPELRPPRFWSDLMRIEEALARAVRAADSAVLLDHIEQQITTDPELALDNTEILTEQVLSLVATGRARQVRHIARVSGGRAYFTTLNGPVWVRSAVEHHLDRRLRAVRLLWRHGGGRPFTTHAVRRYAQGRPSLQILDDPPYGWTNALHALEKVGDVARIPSEVARWVRWAPEPEWSALSESERGARLHDPYGRFIVETGPEAISRQATVPSTIVAPAGSRTDGGTRPGSVRDMLGEHDTSFSSQNQNMRALVHAAKQASGRQESAPERRRIREARPVRAQDVERVAASAPRLRPPPSVPLRLALREAARIRPGVRRPAVAHLGRVGRSAYYDLESSAQSAAYVEFRRALRLAKLYRGLRDRVLSYRVQLLYEAHDSSMLRIMPIHEAILHARAAALHYSIAQRIEALARAARRASLLEEEVADARRTTDQLRVFLDRVGHLLPKVPQQEHRSAQWSSGWLIDSAAAYEQVAGLQGFSMKVPRILGQRLPLVDVIPAEEIDDAGALAGETGTRPVETWLDRAGFALYASMRWGGPHWANLALQAWHTMGDLRDAAPLTHALFYARNSDEAAGAAASLVFVDSPESRRALADYVTQQLAGEGVGRGMLVAQTAVLGLARHRFGGLATRLSTVEGGVLDQAIRLGDERLRWFAERALRTWNEGEERFELYRI